MFEEVEGSTAVVLGDVDPDDGGRPELGGEPSGRPGGEVVLSTTEKYSVFFQGGVLSLRSLEEKSSVRLPAKTVLHLFTAGKVMSPVGEESAVDKVPLKFDKPRDEIVDPDKKVTPLGTFVKSTNADRVFGHEPFTKGSPPTSFLQKKDNRYFPAEDEAPIVRAAQAAKLIKLTWSLYCVAGKVNPKGLAIVTEKLIILKAQETISLMNAR